MASTTRTEAAEVPYQAGRTGGGTLDRTAVPSDSPTDPAQRQPKGDHNRRLALFLDPAVFAAEAGITEAELRDYERTGPDATFDPEIARRVGAALDRLEAATPPSKRIVS